MRAVAFLIALALTTTPVLAAPSVDYADGIQPPRPPHPRLLPVTAPEPEPAPEWEVEEDPEPVTLNVSFATGTNAVSAQSRPARPAIAAVADEARALR